MTKAQDALVRLLRQAYSGERAAAYAYQGHARSVRDPRVKAEIRKIEREEWEHRANNLALLQALGATPSRWLEFKMSVIGRSISAFCRVGGWFMPMYGAGKLERSNIGEYTVAAGLAQAAGHADMVPILLTMAEVEWDHEQYFRRQVKSHWLGRLVPTWREPPPRNSIRDGLKTEALTAGSRA
jgi:ferritin-like metal-binding protein YciE